MNTITSSFVNLFIVRGYDYFSTEFKNSYSICGIFHVSELHVYALPSL